MTEEAQTPVQTVPESSWLYRVVTRYWLRIVTGLVLVIGWASTLFDWLTADGWLSYYLLAWAGMTTGLWALSEKAEKAISEDVRKKVAGWAVEADLGKGIQSIPRHFATLFDHVFGSRKRSRASFSRSSAASMISLWICTLLWMIAHPPPDAWSALAATLFLTFLAFAFNLIPDYLSLLETRYLIRRLERGGSLFVFLLVDTVVTAIIGFGAHVAVFGIAEQNLLGQIAEEGWRGFTYSVFILGDGQSYHVSFGLFFYTTFFTSVWLWIYALSVLASRILLRLNSGVGFLIRVTDVERKPFTSMGFVSVIIVSAIFLLGLPIALLV